MCVARLSRAESQAITREKLFKSGEEVFARRGFHAATIEEIAEAAGYSRGAFYANFADKSDFFTALLERRTRSAMDSIAERIAAVQDDDKLGALLEWVDENIINDALQVAIAEFLPQATRDPEVRARLADRQRQIRAAITGMIDDYLATTGIALPTSTEDVAVMAQALVEGISIQRRLEPDIDEALLAHALTYLWSGLLMPATDT